jgi:hypothetical protein
MQTTVMTRCTTSVGMGCPIKRNVHMVLNGSSLLQVVTGPVRKGTVQIYSILFVGLENDEHDI